MKYSKEVNVISCRHESKPDYLKNLTQALLIQICTKEFKRCFLQAGF